MTRFRKRILTYTITCVILMMAVLGCSMEDTQEDRLKDIDFTVVGEEQRLSHRDVGKLTNDSHQLLIGCQLEHSVPIFRIVKHDGLHTAFQSVKLPAFHLCTHPFVTR